MKSLETIELGGGSFRDSKETVLDSMLFGLVCHLALDNLRTLYLGENALYGYNDSSCSLYLNGRSGL